MNAFAESLLPEMEGPLGRSYGFGMAKELLSNRAD
jgi:hypothetical protein